MVGGIYCGQTYPAGVPLYVSGPINLTPPVITGLVVVGQVLTCDPGSWARVS